MTRALDLMVHSYLVVFEASPVVLHKGIHRKSKGSCKLFGINSSRFSMALFAEAFSEIAFKTEQKWHLLALTFFRYIICYAIA